MSDFKLEIDVTELRKAKTDLAAFAGQFAKTGKNAEASASVFVSAIEREIRSLNKAAQANRVYAQTAQNTFNATLGVSRASKSAADSASVFEAAIKKSNSEAAKQLKVQKQVAAEYKRVKASIDPLFAAEQKYAAFRKTLRDNLKAGNITFGEARVAIKQYRAEAKKAGLTINQFGVQTALAGRNIKQLRANAQQFGYQIQDVAVQMQMGINPMVILGQQGSQLLGIFGAGGALAGAGLAIGAAFLAPLFAAAKQAKDTKKQVDLLAEAVSNYKSASMEAGRTTKDLAEDFGEYADQALRALGALRDFNEEAAKTSINNSLGAFSQVDDFNPKAAAETQTTTLLGFEVFSSTLKESVVDEVFKGSFKAREEVERLKDLLGATEQEAISLANSLNLAKKSDLRAAPGFLQDALDVLNQMTPASEELKAEVNKFGTEVSKTSTEILEYLNTLESDPEDKLFKPIKESVSDLNDEISALITEISILQSGGGKSDVAAELAMEAKRVELQSKGISLSSDKAKSLIKEAGIQARMLEIHKGTLEELKSQATAQESLKQKADELKKSNKDLIEQEQLKLSLMKQGNTEAEIAGRLAALQKRQAFDAIGISDPEAIKKAGEEAKKLAELREGQRRLQEAKREAAREEREAAQELERQEREANANRIAAFRKLFADKRREAEKEKKRLEKEADEEAKTRIAAFKKIFDAQRKAQKKVADDNKFLDDYNKKALTRIKQEKELIGLTGIQYAQKKAYFDLLNSISGKEDSLSNRDLEGDANEIGRQAFELSVANSIETFRQYQTELDKTYDGEFRLLELKGVAFEEESAYQDLIQELGDDVTNLTELELRRVAKVIAANERLLDAAEEQKKTQEKLANDIASTFGDGFLDIVDGTKTVKEAFKSMAQDILRELFKVLVVQRLVGKAGGPGGGSGLAGIISSGLDSLPSFDGGGYLGSAPRTGGVDGKGGFLMIGHPQETVVDHTKGQSLSGGDNYYFTYEFKMDAMGDESVKKAIYDAAPAIVEQSKNAVLSTRHRGGSFRRGF